MPTSSSRSRFHQPVHPKQLLTAGVELLGVEGGARFTQINLLIRPNDPIYEAACAVFGSRAEDKMGQHTLRQLDAYLGPRSEVETDIVKVDRKRQWKYFGNIRHNSVAAHRSASRSGGHRPGASRRGLHYCRPDSDQGDGHALTD